MAETPHPPFHHDSVTGAAMLLAPLLAALRQRGVDVDALLAARGMLAPRAAHSCDRVANSVLLSLWEDAVRLSGDDNIGFVAAAQHRPGTFHVCFVGFSRLLARRPARTRSQVAKVEADVAYVLGRAPNNQGRRA